jgi:hypothetical protein
MDQLTHEQAVWTLAHSQSLADLAEAAAFLTDDPTTDPGELLPALDHPGVVADQAAIALHRLTGTPVSADSQPVTQKAFWSNRLRRLEAVADRRTDPTMTAWGVVGRDSAHPDVLGRKQASERKVGGSAGLPVRPSEDALLTVLRMEWQDHIQTRSQTWKTLQIEAILAVGLVGISGQLENPWATAIFAIAVVVAAVMGCLVTLRHRNDTERRKFTHILNIEEELGMHTPDLLPNVAVPNRMTFTDAFRPWKSNTSLFILRMHIAILVFGLVYAAYSLQAAISSLLAW